MKKIIAFALVLLTVISPVCASEIFTGSLSAKSAVLYDPLTRRILWSRSCDDTMLIASTTKIMTALLSLELYDLDSPVEILPAWTGIEGSSMYLKPGETMTVRDLVYGLMLMSGNDAAVALSSILTGDQRDFVDLMNKKASALGMYNTSFENPNGLDGQAHYSTAQDMAVLAAAAMDNDDFREIVSCKNATVAGRYMKNHNKLLSMYPSVCGVKTGFTKKAGRCLVTAAEDKGRQLIAVTLSAPDDWNDHIALYDSAFGLMEEKILVAGGEVGSIPIVSGEKDRCRLYISEDFSFNMLPGDEENVSICLKGPRMVYAPVSSGDVFGELTVSLGGHELFTTKVYYKEDIALCRPEKTGFFHRLMERIFGM